MLGNAQKHESLVVYVTLTLVGSFDVDSSCTYAYLSNTVAVPDEVRVPIAPAWRPDFHSRRAVRWLDHLDDEVIFFTYAEAGCQIMRIDKNVSSQEPMPRNQLFKFVFPRATTRIMSRAGTFWELHNFSINSF